MRAARALAALALVGPIALLFTTLCGFRPCVAVIAGGGAECSDAGAGAAYALAYFATVLATHILGLAAALLYAAERIADRALGPKESARSG